jgi:hypothetical protein
LTPVSLRPLRFGAMSCAVAMTVAISATTRAQQQPPFRSGANYVRVDVYPTASGRPVQDLTASDFQLFEDGKPQKIEAFEHVSPQTARPAVPEPGSVEASRRVAGPGRGRVFVVFLDAAHVTSQGSGKIAEPLIGLLDAVIGAEDLVGVMTSDMTASQVVLGRKIDVFARGLRDNPVWGRRYDRTKFDERERKYDECYPMVRQERANGRLMSELAQSLIERRRERRTFDALNDLVTYLGSAGDTRKTIFTITEGWMLFRPDQQLLEPRYRNPDDAATREPVPGKKGVTIRDGKLTTDDPSNLNSLRYSCVADRLSLANLDVEQFL